MILYCTQNDLTATMTQALGVLIRDKGPGQHELPDELHELLYFKKRLGKTTAKDEK